MQRQYQTAIPPGSESEAFVVSEYQSGRSMTTIGNLLGLSAGAIRNCLRRANVPRRSLKEIARTRVISDGLTAQQRRYRKLKSDPEVYLHHSKNIYTQNLKRKYGLSREEYEEILESQDGRCLICKIPLTEDIRFGVDHCHTTGNVRGILCDACNVLLSRAKDNPAILASAIDYLNLPPYKSNSASTQR